MRFLLLFAVAAVNLIFTGAVFPNINLFGIAPDIIICTISSIAILEIRMSGAVFGLACGLVLDLMFTGSIGFYAMAYFLTGAASYGISMRLRYVDKYIVPGCFAAGAYLFKELTSALLVYMTGLSFSLPQMLFRYILPEALFTGVFMLLVHTLMRKLYRAGSIRPRSSKDIKRLG